jgi:RNA polymerase subunit RPABC4/transcription elongation factor Spt4
MSEEKLVKCKNCTYELRKNIRRCPYCGILNPTVTTKEVIVTTIIVIVVMYAITVLIK